MSSHATCPYRTVADDQRWDRSFSPAQAEYLDPYTARAPKFKFDKTSAIATFGSCFAQNISRHLTQRDYNFLRTEYDPALTPTDNTARGNDMFSARRCVIRPQLRRFSNQRAQRGGGLILGARFLVYRASSNTCHGDR